MRIKRWVCALLCLALLLGVLPEVRAAEVSGNFEYKLEQSGSPLAGMVSGGMASTLLQMAPASMNRA